MPQGMGTYGSKVGRPPKKKAHGGKVVKKGKGSKILGSLSPVYGMISGKGAFANLPSPAGLLAKKMRKNRKAPVAATARAKMGGKQIPEGNAGLGKLPTEVRNNMGYMAYGGKVKKMGTGGSTCKGMGKATRGGSFGKNG